MSKPKECTKKDLLNVFGLCLDINRKHNLHAFFDYSAHVKWVCVTIYPSYTEYVECEERIKVYDSRFYTDDQAKQRKVLADLKTILAADKSEYSATKQEDRKAA